MHVFRGFHHPGIAPACALTIGNFDGVHRGHQAMLALLRSEAQHRGLPSCVMTFEPHPRDYFAAVAGKPELAPARIATLRDKHAADLVAYFRPASTDDATCGASWLNGAGLAGVAGIDQAHAFVIANVSPCGPHVLAHEIGHVLGAVHDRASQTDADGNVAYGAYAYAFGYRTKQFGTIMADPGRAPWIGRFSNPRKADCNGARCGVDDDIHAMHRAVKTLAVAHIANEIPQGWMVISMHLHFMLLQFIAAEDNDLFGLLFF